MIRTKFAGWLVFSCLGLLAWAVPVLACVTSPIPVTLQQPDGTKITLRFRGDKYYHWFEDLAGYTVVRAGAAYYYAELGPHGELVATQHEVGKADPAALALPPKLKASARAIAEQRRRVLVSPPGPPPPITSIAPAGVVKNLVVLCKFSDHSFGSHTRPEADYDVLFNTIGGDPVLAPTGSVRDSYAENSYGIMDLQSTVAVWVTLPHPESYYTNGSSGLGGSYPQNPQGMVEDALNLVDALVDFGTFDTDNDGFIDAIDIVHSGYGAETGGGGGNWMWSHRWSLWALPGGDWVSNDTNASGNQVHVFDYHTEPALWGTSGTNIIRIGVIAHETGHFFGLPDLYDINGGGEGLGSYGMMANSWGFDFSQHFPPHFCAYSKIFLNWVSPVTISAPGTYSLTAVEISPEVFRVDQNYPGGEYLLIENRQPIGLDGDMPQGGLCIWHIDTAKSGNTDEGYPGQSGWPGNNQHYRVALLQADGNYDMEHGNNRGDGGDVYHAGGVNAINETTTPNTDSYQFGNVFATNNALSAISASGTTMTFTFGSLIDCNGNSIPDDVDIANGTSLDCNADGVPDECELGANDCNGNGIPDDCDIAGGLENDCNANLVPDSCEIGIAGTILSADFEAGLPASWAATGMFSVTGGCDPGAHCDGNLWAYAGNNGSCTYGDGQSGQLIAPPVTLGYGISTLTFCHRYDTEVGFDFCTLRVNGQAVWQVSGTNDAWHDEVVDLSAFNGQTVDVRWELVSDAFVSGTLGWQVDRIALDTGVPDCNGNGVPDACDIAQGTSQDLNGDGIPDECAGCTLDSQCDDGVFCNGVETCVAGVCAAGTPPDCSDGIACTIDACDPSADACVNVPFDDVCDNFLFCDGVEVCQAGVGCVSGSAPDCNDAIACTADACNEATDACDHVADDALCDNFLFCDGVEVCQAGVGCVSGSAPNCNDGIACTADSCNEATDACDHVTNDALCDNGLFCDGVETCQAGVGCAAGVAPDCNDAIACTADSCNEATDSCDHATDDALCDNGLFCDGAESCQVGVGCVNGTAPDCNDAIACTADACNEATDACDHVANDALCDNGLFCDGAESCQVGVGCVNGTAPDCNDAIACTSDACNEATDACDHVADDAQCDNGLFCDGVETCQAGVGCAAGVAPDCNDAIACTADSCNEATDACDHVADDALCDNGLFCDGVEICDVLLGCLDQADPCPGPLSCDEVLDQCGCASDADCDDANLCTDDVCDLASGSCSNLINYDDATVCCDPASGSLTLLDDGDPCTSDVCDPATGGVTHPPANPDLCVVSLGSRYLGITPTGVAGVPVSLRVAIEPAGVGACFSAYVQPDGTLGAAPAFQTPDLWGTATVSGPDIIPDTTYSVYAEDGVDVSQAAHATTSLWGDVDLNATVNFADIQSTVLMFQGQAPATEAADVDPCDPDHVVNFSDILAIVLAFQGESYLITDCPLPCG